MVLVRKTAWKGKHKIQDRWESDEYQVIGQPNPDIPVYKVECVAGGRTRILHRNLLLPLQGKIRQPGGLEVEDLPTPDEEEDEEDGIPGVTRAPQVRTRRRNSTPQSNPTQQVKATGKDAFYALKSKDSSDFRQLSDMLDDESSEEEELYTDSLTSHTTASDNTTIGNLSSPLGPIASRVEEPSTVSQTESQFSSNMPHLEESTQFDNTGISSNSSTEDSVFTSHFNYIQLESQINSPTPPIPRSTRITRGQPPERYGQVYTFGTIISNASECPKHRQTMYIPCYNC